MRNSTIEKLKEIMKGGKLTEDRINFARMILAELDCPISIITNKQCFLEELEIYKFESKDTNTIIDKAVTSIIGQIAYNMETSITLDNFTETKKVPRLIGTKTNNVVYIEETKTVLVNGHPDKTILDRKIILFLDQADNLDNNYADTCYIIA